MNTTITTPTPKKPARTRSGSNQTGTAQQSSLFVRSVKRVTARAELSTLKLVLLLLRAMASSPMSNFGLVHPRLQMDRYFPTKASTWMDQIPALLKAQTRHMFLPPLMAAMEQPKTVSGVRLPSQAPTVTRVTSLTGFTPELQWTSTKLLVRSAL